MGGVHVDQRNAKVVGCIKMFRRRHTRIATGGGCKLSPFGTYADENTCLSDPATRCGSYVCGAGGIPRIAVGTEVGVSRDGLFCWKCNGTAGPDSTCEMVADGTTTGGQYDSEDSCETNATAMCGWGYKQNSGVCELSNAVRGTSFDSCFVGTDTSNWKYGCFDKFARRGGKCVGIPSTGDNGPRNFESVYPSLTVCEIPGRVSQWTPESITVNGTGFKKVGEGKREDETLGVRINSREDNTNTIPNTASDMITCMTLCENDPTCLALNFRHDTGVCDLVKSSVQTKTYNTNLSAYTKQ